MTTHDRDLIIVGAGPAGISLAAEARRSGVPAEKILVLEKGQEHSWAIRKFYPDSKPVTANYKGQAAVCSGVLCIADTDKDGLLSYLDQAIVDHAIEVRYNTAVGTIHPLPEGGFKVDTDHGQITTNVCAIAIGILGRPNKPEYKLPGKLKARVHFDINSHPIRASRVLVVGGGDSASEYAQFLVQEGNTVSLSYRRDTFARMNDINQDSLYAMERADKVTLLRSSNITELKVSDDGSPIVCFAEEAFGELEYDHVLYALGGTTPQNFLTTIGIAFDGPSPVLGEGYETSVPGLFLVGDLSAGTKGGSVISAFNSSREAMTRICADHLDCKVEAPFSTSAQPMAFPEVNLGLGQGKP